jgi:hypothetical protein
MAYLHVIDIDEVLLTHMDEFATDAGADVLLDQFDNDYERLARVQAIIYEVSAKRRRMVPCEPDLVAFLCSRIDAAPESVVFLTSRDPCTKAATALQLAVLLGQDRSDAVRVVHCLCDKGRELGTLLASFDHSMYRGIVFIDDKVRNVDNVARELRREKHARAFPLGRFCMRYGKEDDRQRSIRSRAPEVASTFWELARRPSGSWRPE